MEKQFTGVQVEYLPIGELSRDPGNPRMHSHRQIRMIGASLRRFGFVNPILIDRNKRIIAGHGRWEAAKREGHTTVPTILLEHLTEDQRRAYVIAENLVLAMSGAALGLLITTKGAYFIADNRLAEKGRWDKQILEIELQHLVAVGFDIEVTGFEVPEVDLVLDAAAEKEHDPGPEDNVPDVRRDRPAVTRPGDLWLLGPNGNPRHRLLVGDARDPAAISRLMDDISTAAEADAMKPAKKAPPRTFARRSTCSRSSASIMACAATRIRRSSPSSRSGASR